MEFSSRSRRAETISGSSRRTFHARGRNRFSQCPVGILDDRREFSGRIGEIFLDNSAILRGLVMTTSLRFPLPRYENSSSISSVVRRNSGGLVIRVIKSFSGHDDPAVDLVLRIHEMDVTRCHNRLMELLAKFDDVPVDLL